MIIKHTTTGKIILKKIDFELNYQMCSHQMNVYWWEPPIVKQGSQCGLFKTEIQI